MSLAASSCSLKGGAVKSAAAAALAMISERMPLIS